MTEKLVAIASNSAYPSEPWMVARVSEPPGVWVWGRKPFNTHAFPGLEDLGSYRYPVDSLSGVHRTLQMVELMAALQKASVCYTASFRFTSSTALPTSPGDDPLFEELFQSWTKSPSEHIVKQIGPVAYTNVKLQISICLAPPAGGWEIS